MENHFKTKTSDCTTEEWREHLKHEDVMKTLSGIRGHEVNFSCDYGYCKKWVVDAPNVEVLREIVERGVIEEILYLIHQYGRALPPKSAPEGCSACNDGKWDVTVIPEEIQEMIAKRGIAVEMAAFIEYYGFGAKGQNVILERGNHDEIMWYLDKHGLLLEQQRKLFARGNQEEIDLHLFRHGMHDALINEMFKEMKEGDDRAIDLFYRCIKGPEFSVKFQKKMLGIVKSSEFEAYVSIHGLWEDAHEALVENRSDREVRYYIIRHHYLSSKAARMYVERTSTSDRMFFMKNAISGVFFTMDVLLKVKPYDYESLEYGFANYEYHKLENDKKEVQLMDEGEEGQIIEYVANKRSLNMWSWATLFYRNDRNLFERCLAIVFDR